MTVIESSENILETSVTWADVERNLRSVLKTEAKFGANKSVLNIGDQKGFASICALITCDWVGSNAPEKLPKRVIIKVPSFEPLRKMNESVPHEQRMMDGDEEFWKSIEEKMRQLLDIEVASYNFFAKFDGVTVPRKYYEVMSEANGHVCLEFMENSRNMDIHVKHTVDQVRQIARAIGEIQACSIKQKPTSAEFERNIFEEYSKMLTMEAHCGMFKGLLGLDRSPSTIQLSTQFDKLLPEYYGLNMPTDIPKVVLTNGDLRAENVLVDKETGDLMALIDWQSTHMGVGVEDLIRIQLFSLTTKDRRASTSMLIGEMYDSLVANLDGAMPPYKLEKLREYYDIIFPFSAIFFGGPAIMFANKLASDTSLSAEEKEERKAIMLDKILGAMEDTVELDAKRKNNN